MAENTEIEWADHTFNPWEGCQKVGPGCDHCYAETRNARYNGGETPNWGPGAPRRRTSAANWAKPERWQRDAAAFYAEHGRKQRVFCASLADVFDNAVDPAWRADLSALIRRTPDLEWLLLTKRAGNVLNMLIAMFPSDPPDNVRCGFTIVTQDEWNRDRNKIAAVSVACKLKPFLSMEPLLMPVDLGCNNGKWPAWYRYIGWVIVGGESGPNARPIDPSWVRDIRDECAASEVPFLFKQWGEWMPEEDMHPVKAKATYQRDLAAGRTYRFVGTPMRRVGKKDAGRLLDGRTHDEAPA
jgi:protein gp37